MSKPRLPLVRALGAALVLALVTTGAACGGDAEEAAAEAPPAARQGFQGAGFTGSLRVLAAEPVAPAVQRQADAFGRAYRQARVEVVPTSTRDAVVGLVRGQAQAAVIDRPLNAEERSALATARRTISEVPLGQGALVIVVNPASPARTLTIDSLRAIARGDGVRLPGGAGPARLALAPLEAGATLLLTDRLLPAGQLPRPAYAARDERDVLDWVARTPDGIGVVSLAAYAADTTRRVRPLQLPDDEGHRTNASPLDVYAGVYPLRHPITLVVADGSGPIGAGFATFAAQIQGQEAIQRAGLVPARLPAREIELR